MQNIDHPQYVRMHQEWIDCIQIPKTSVAATAANLPNQARLRTVLASQRGRKPLPSPILNSRRRQETGGRRELAQESRSEQVDAGPVDPLPSQRVQAGQDALVGELASVQVQGRKIDQTIPIPSARQSPSPMPSAASPDSAGGRELVQQAEEPTSLVGHGDTGQADDIEKTDCHTQAGAVAVAAKGTGVDQMAGATAARPQGGQEAVSQASRIRISRHTEAIADAGPDTVTAAHGPSHPQDRHRDFPNAGTIPTPGPQTPEGPRDALYSSENHNKAGQGGISSQDRRARTETQKEEPLLAA